MGAALRVKPYYLRLAAKPRELTLGQPPRFLLGERDRFGQRHFAALIRRDLLVPDRTEGRLLGRVSRLDQRAHFLDQTGGDHRVEARVDRRVEFFALHFDPPGQTVQSHSGASLPPPW